jgi:integrase
MSKVRFYLKAPDNTGESLISLYFSFNKKRLVYSTGLKVPPKFWSDETQRAAKTKQFPQYLELNAYLDNITHETLNIYRRFLNEGKVPSVAQLKSELDAFTLRGNTAGNTSLFGFIEQFIRERESLPKFSKGIIFIYKRAYNHLKKFSKQNQRELDFQDIDLDFFYDFQKYLYEPPVSYSQNTAHKMIKTIKTIMSEATERGLNKNLAFQSRRFSIPQKEVESIYLTTEELLKIYNLKLENYLPRLDKVRDLFLIGAFTGLRFSDFTNIKPENFRSIEGVEVIQITTIKTGEPVTVPVHNIVKRIFEKYNGKPPKAMSNQKMNVYLKELAELAEMNEPVILTKDKGGKRYDRQFKKWELVTTHTARRSFATNAFKAGIPAISIMKITGHRTEAAFMKYIKISKEENAVLIAKNAFFQTSPLKAIR